MGMFRLLLHLVFVALIFATTTTSSLAERRVALVIGNSAYEHVQKLPNPLKDANDIAAAFERLSFEVTLLTNQTSRDMRRALRDFARKSPNRIAKKVRFHLILAPLLKLIRNKLIRLLKQ